MISGVLRPRKKGSLEFLNFGCCDDDLLENHNICKGREIDGTWDITIGSQFRRSLCLRIKNIYIYIYLCSCAHALLWAFSNSQKWASDSEQY